MPFSESLKLAVRRKSHFGCCVCKQYGVVEIHHIVPEADRGPDTEDNAAPLCPTCHETFGGNPTKRKMIREMRDHWYEVCSVRFGPNNQLVDALRDLEARAVTKEELKAFGRDLSEQIQQKRISPPREAVLEIDPSPITVTARSPRDRSRSCEFRLPLTLPLGTKSRLIELWTLIVGALPQGTTVPDGHQLSCLLDAVACFGGFKRPFQSDVDDRRVTYVLNPHTVFSYDGGKLRAHRAPNDTVFLVNIVLDRDLATFERGELVHWSFYVADTTNPMMPQDYNERFVKRLW